MCFNCLKIIKKDECGGITRIGIYPPEWVFTDLISGGIYGYMKNNKSYCKECYKHKKVK